MVDPVSINVKKKSERKNNITEYKSFGNLFRFMKKNKKLEQY